MSPLQLTQEQRVKTLERFGYGEVEAGFLCLAALHGGYFLRRQFVAFVGGQDGGTVTQLTHKAAALGHVRTSTWRQNTQLHHLCARPFYEALGQGDNRNRRPREMSAIKNKIMGLDFVLANREAPYLATESEKLEYFLNQLNIDRASLPAKRFHAARAELTTTRYFVDKYPLFLTHAPQDGDVPVPSFCFVDEGMVSLSRFETYLDQYRPLFEALPGFQLIYVAADERHVAGARGKFERSASGPTTGSSTESAGGSGHDLARLLAYFHARRLYEQQQFAALDRSQLIRLREARSEFSQPEHEALYATWQAGGDAAIREQLTPNPASIAPLRGTFSTCVLEHDYGLFGTTAPY